MTQRAIKEQNEHRITQFIHQALPLLYGLESILGDVDLVTNLAEMPEFIETMDRLSRSLKAQQVIVSDKADSGVVSGLLTAHGMSLICQKFCY